MNRTTWGGIILVASLTILSGTFAMGSDVLVDGFEGTDFAPQGGLYYKDNFEQSAGSVEFQKAVARNGGGALKLTVNALCKTSGDECSERAEIWEKTELRVPYDQGVWYGFAVKFGDPVPRDDHRYLIAQWKREIEEGAVGDFSPFLALRLNKGKLFATVETNFHSGAPGIGPGKGGTCAEGTTPVWLRPDTNQMRALVATPEDWALDNSALFQSCIDKITVTDRGNKIPDPGSGWIDFAIYSKPGPGGDGHIEVFANDKWVVTVKGHIGHADKGLGPNQYFKFGPYRAGHAGEWTLYYDDFRRSPRCADVLKGAPCPF